MADFDLAVKTVLANEGGFINHPKDPGGATNHGISLRFYQQNVKKWADKGDIADLTIDEATSLYLKYFWSPFRYNMIANQNIATKVLDMGVIIGSQTANRGLQRACLAVSDMKLDIDGILGPKTLYVVNNSPPDQLLAAFKADTACYYRNLVEKDPDSQVFLAGWLNRCYSDI